MDLLRPLFHRFRMALITLAVGGLTWLAGCAANGTSAAIEAESRPSPEPGEPALTAADMGPAATVAPPLPVFVPGAIQNDLLLVNGHALSVPEVLYPLRHAVAAAKREHGGARLGDELAMIVAREVQQSVGLLLLYDRAWAELNDRQREMVDSAVNRELENRISRSFGGSRAAYNQHLSRYGLTYAQIRSQVRTAMVVRSYSRERIMPRVHVRRDELLAHYERNRHTLASPETRELFMIELPFEKFLPPGQSWDSASIGGQRQAKLAALRAARAASDELRTVSFEDVARRHSRGLFASEGGSWGAIGGPLNPPYDEVSRRIFSFSQGQVSEPVELPHGWVIVKCGRIESSVAPSFSEAQDAVREQLMEERFNQFSADYLTRLAEQASISDTRDFIMAATTRALEPGWPPPDPSLRP